MSDWNPGWFFNNESAHPVVADALLLITFGAEVYDWEPETLWREMNLTWRASPTPENRDCIQAVRTIHTNSRFTYDWITYEKVVLGLNTMPVSFLEGQQPTLGQVMAATDAIKIIRPVTYNDEVARYVAAVVIDDAAYPVPGILDFCKQYVPLTVPNDNAKDDEAYRQERVQLMRTQLASALKWLGWN